MKNPSASPFRRTLTLLPLVVLGLAYMAPMTVFSTYGVVAQASHGMVPTSYLVALIGMLFTAYNYGKMAKAYPTAGSAYTYTQKSINPYLGFLVGWSVLMDYLFLPMINVLLTSIFLSAAFPNILMKIWVVVFAALFTGINLLGIHITLRINGILVLFQFIITMLFVVLSIKGINHGMGLGTLLSSTPFYHPGEPFSFIMIGASILCLSFLGFDAVTTLSEETVNPRKVVPRAIFLVALTGGILFTFVSYVAVLIFPDYTAFKLVDSAAFEIAEFIGGSFFGSFFLAGMITSTLASGISTQTSAARLLFAMGRERVLPPKYFAYIHPKLQTPFFNVLLIGSFSLFAMTMSLATAASFINFGALVAFTFVNLSVFFHYYIHQKQRGFMGFFQYVLMPLIGASFMIWLWSNLNQHSLLLGSIWLFAGFIYLLFLTKCFRKKPPELGLFKAN